MPEIYDTNEPFRPMENQTSPEPKEKPIEDVEQRKDREKKEQVSRDSEKNELNNIESSFSSDSQESKFNTAPLSSAEAEKAYSDTQQIIRDNQDVGARYISGRTMPLDYASDLQSYGVVGKPVMLPGGRACYAIYCPPSYENHRSVDSAKKSFSGTEMEKVPREKWAENFKKNTNVPILYSSPKEDLVLMPRIDGVNMNDLFRKNKEIKDWGKQEWANQVDLNRKLDIFRNTVKEMYRCHQEGQTWGETNLPNFMCTREGKVYFTCPDTQYKDGVSDVEKKARDLRTLALSVGGALNQSEGFTDYAKIKSIIKDNYPDSEVVKKLSTDLAKPRIMENITGYVKDDYGINSSGEYEKILNQMRETPLATPAPSTIFGHLKASFSGFFGSISSGFSKVADFFKKIF